MGVGEQELRQLAEDASTEGAVQQISLGFSWFHMDISASTSLRVLYLCGACKVVFVVVGVCGQFHKCFVVTLSPGY